MTDETEKMLNETLITRTPAETVQFARDQLSWALNGRPFSADMKWETTQRFFTRLENALAALESLR